jgi:hypothetical protein
MKLQMKLAKIIRILTIAPIGAFLLNTVLFFNHAEGYGSMTYYLLAVLYLTLLPVMAYPLQPLIPGFKDKGREGQRNLAIVMANLGYLCGILTITFLAASRMQWIIYLTYFLSGIGIAVFNKLIKIPASGHACGIVGPIALSVYFIGLYGIIIGSITFLLMCWSSIKLKRHTLPQLLLGSIIPIAALLAIILLLP